MKTIVAVRDRAIDAFGQPFFVQSKGEAIRSFQDVVNSAEETNQINKHPEDFDLYSLGTYDEQTGRIEQKETPEMIAVGKDMVRAGQ